MHTDLSSQADDQLSVYTPTLKLNFTSKRGWSFFLKHVRYADVQIMYGSHKGQKLCFVHARDEVSCRRWEKMYLPRECTGTFGDGRAFLHKPQITVVLDDATVRHYIAGCPFHWLGTMHLGYLSPHAP